MDVVEKPSDADLKRARTYIESVEWRFAKTMPESPHCYAKRAWSPDAAEFDWFMAFTRQYGVNEKFGKTKTNYFYLDGWKYWSGWKSINLTRWINRAEAIDTV